MNAFMLTLALGASWGDVGIAAPVAAPPPVTVPASTIDAAVALHQAAKAAPVAAPVFAPLVGSPCANGNCPTQRRGLFGRRR